MIHIEPGWATFGLGIVLFIGGMISGWYRYGTRITILEDGVNGVRNELKAVRRDIGDGDKRITRLEDVLIRPGHGGPPHA